MKISGARAEAFIEKPDAGILAVLVFGPNRGLVAERIDRLTRGVASDPADPFRVVDLDGGGLRKDPARLLDEAMAMSLTGGRRVVRIWQATDAQGAILKEFLEAFAGDTLVLVEGGELGPRSNLRKTFEGAKTAAAVACYADDPKALSGLIRKVLGESGLEAAPEAIGYLADSLGGDRGVTRRELDKLALFKGKTGTVTLEEAVACVGDNGAASLDALVYAAAGGDRRGLDKALTRAGAEGVQPITVLRAMARHLLRLHLARGFLAKGLRADEATKKLRPPVIFKHAGAFSAQLGRWNEERLARALDLVGQAEMDCKSTGMPAAAICARALMRVAQAAGR